MDDIFDDLPNERELTLPARGETGPNIQVQTMNANLGAIRVAVPRNMAVVMTRIGQSAQVSGSKWQYSIPFKKKLRDKVTKRVIGEKTELVTGPSITCALEVARAYGNSTVDVEKVEEVGDSWVFHAVFLDIETGFRLGRPFRQRKSQNVGGMGGDQGRSEDVVFQIGASKAIRNVVVNALKGIIDEALDAAQDRIVERIERNRPKIEARIRERLDENGIELRRVERFFGKTFTDMKASHLAQIIKLLQAVSDDLISAEEAFSEELAEPQEGGEPLPENSPEQAGSDPYEANGAGNGAAPEPAAEPAKKRRIKSYSIKAGDKVRVVPGLKGAVDEFFTLLQEAGTAAELSQLLQNRELLADMGEAKAAEARAIFDARLAELQPQEGGP